MPSGSFGEVAVLHVLSGPADGAGGAVSRTDEELCALAETLAGSCAAPEVVALVGGASLVERARDIGLTAPIARIAPRGGAELRRVWEALGGRGVVVCWDRASAALAGGLRGARVVRLDVDANGAVAPEPRAAMEGMWPGLVARSPTVIGPVVGEGGIVSGVSLTSGPIRCETEGARADDGAVRVLIAGREPHGDAVRGVVLLGLLWRSGARVRGVMRSACGSMGRARRLARELGTGYGAGLEIVVSSRPTRELIRSCEVAAFVGSGLTPADGDACSAGAAWWTAVECVRAGVPLVAPGWALPRGLLLEDEAEACIASNATLPELARVLLPLVEDAGRRARVRAGFGRARDPWAAAGIVTLRETISALAVEAFGVGGTAGVAG